MKKGTHALIGKWQMVCWKGNSPGGWKELKSYSDGQFVWDLQTDGFLIESMVGELPSMMQGFASQKNLVLYVHGVHSRLSLLLSKGSEFA